MVSRIALQFLRRWRRYEINHSTWRVGPASHRAVAGRHPVFETCHHSRFDRTPTRRAQASETVLVTADWSVKEPVPNKASTTFFTTDDNLLVRTDPRQREMFGVVAGKLPEAPAKAAEAKTAS